jgi:hypothetical protein
MDAMTPTHECAEKGADLGGPDDALLHRLRGTELIVDVQQGAPNQAQVIPVMEEDCQPRWGLTRAWTTLCYKNLQYIHRKLDTVQAHP